MQRLAHLAAYSLAATILLSAGCAVERDHPVQRRQADAEYQDHQRHEAYERCRAEGRRNCDDLLNTPVEEGRRADADERDHERHEAYERCREEGGHDCDDLLHR